MDNSALQVLSGYKQMLPNFDDFLASLDPARQQKLKSTFGV